MVVGRLVSVFNGRHLCNIRNHRMGMHLLNIVSYCVNPSLEFFSTGWLANVIEWNFQPCLVF